MGALEKVNSYLVQQKYNWEAIVVDDGSRDDSIVLLKKFIKQNRKFRLIQRKHQGKAGAVTAGVLDAAGQYILFTDLDQATPIDQLEKLFPYFNKGFDLVIGSRNNRRQGAPLLRLAMARGFMILRNLILDLGFRDTQCGFKAMSRQVSRYLFPRLKVFSPTRKASGSTVTAGFDIELLYLAKKTGFKIAEVPVEWHYQETRNINPLKDSWESLLDLIRIRLSEMS